MQLGEGLEARTYYHWEFVLYFQKVILMLVITNIVHKAMIQAVIVALTISIMFYIQLYNNPYRTWRLQVIHLVSLFVCL